MSELWPETSGCTPFAVLGIAPGASVVAIRQAFKKMALRTHPDKQHQANTTSSSNCGEVHTASSSPADAVDSTSSPHTTTNYGTTVVTYPFHLVKAAAELLLDPHSRRKYEQHYMQAAVREIGAVSERCSLSEDFILVAEDTSTSTTRQMGKPVWRLYERECRCGGCYELLYFCDEEEEKSGREEFVGGERERVGQAGKAMKRKLCECESCSLIIEVECDVD